MNSAARLKTSTQSGHTELSLYKREIAPRLLSDVKRICYAKIIR